MDYSKYHPDWKDIIRPAILKRDKYACRHCGVTHKSIVYKNSMGAYVVCDAFIAEWAKSNGYRVFKLHLQIAHVDHNKSNNEDINLLTLCPKCHSRYDADHKIIARIARRAKSKSLKKGDQSPDTTEREAILHNIRVTVREITGVQIIKLEAAQILQTVLNSINYEIK